MTRTREEVFEALKAIIVDYVDVEEDKVVSGARFVEDLGVDSLDLVQMGLAAEEVFGLRLTNRNLERMPTVEAAVTFILKHAK